jgi:toxin ParE1/3/4
MKVIWEGEAKRELREAIAYIRKDSPAAAKRVNERIKLAARALEHFPDKYRAGPVGGTREQVIQGLPYIMVYRVEADHVRVVAFFHTSRDIPRGG